MVLQSMLIAIIAVLFGFFWPVSNRNKGENMKTEAEIFYERMNRHNRQANTIAWVILTPIAIVIFAIFFFAIKG